ncbi:MAG: ribosome biogenesis GTP-binding protein YsxC [Gammaproteobacteria bacterium]|nr:ribosome biogenesis GTP-binding protein YsxC [Gammaproteobacteria bacterium]
MSAFPRARFLASAGAPGGFGDDSGAEVAVAGRSNSGKSSAINVILGRRGLARASATPGRTQLVNFFELEPGRRLVDLPGYGYARAPVAAQQRWARLAEDYFRRRQSLAGLLLVVDVRRGVGDADRVLLDYAAARGLPVHVLLTKADKLTRNEARVAARRSAADLAGRATVQAFSAVSGEGGDAARGALAAMLAGRSSAGRQ